MAAIRAPSVTRWTPNRAAAAGASGAEARERDDRQRGQQPGGRGRHRERVAHLGEHRADADRRRAQVQRQHHEAEQDEGRRAAGGGAHSADRLRAGVGGLRQDGPHAPGERRRAPTPAGPAARARARAPRLGPGRRDPGDDRAARDRGAERLPLAVGAGRRAHRRRRRPGAVRRPQPGQAARDAPHPVRVPARPAARRRGGAPRPGSPGAHRVRLAKDVELGGLADDGAAWLDAAEAATLAHLADGAELSAQQLREQVPELAGRVEVSPGKSYGGSFPLAPRVLTQLGVEAKIVRGSNAGHWRTARPQWTATGDLARRDVPEPAEEREGYAELVRRWLVSFGPGTESRHRLVAGLDQGRRPRRAGRRRRGRGRPRRGSDRLGAPGRRARKPRSSRGRRCCRCSTRR